MPKLDFCAIGEDQRAVLDVVFDLGRFRVFGAYSEPDARLREFRATSEITDVPHGIHLMLYVVDSGPEPVRRRIDLRPGALGGAKGRYRLEGWGLVQLHFGILFRGVELRWSHTNHDTEARATKWAPTLTDLGAPDAWDWSLVTKASRLLNRKIRSMAVRKIGTHPVLAHADELIERRNLQFEYGTGMHLEPSPGMRAAGPEAH